MKIIKNNIFRIQYLILLSFILFTAIGCSDDNQAKDQEENDKSTFFDLSVKAASSSINEDKVLWEDRVDELRMIVFDSGSGDLVFNQKLYFPNGLSGKSRGVSIKPGTYNFYFIANETVYAGDFVTALEAIGKESDFKTDNRFQNLAYNPNFTPDGNSQGGRFLMSAIYNGITVATGGTEANPAPLVLPTSKVELIRALAKVDIVFRKRVSGSTVPANAITSVHVDNVATNLSIPPFDGYYTGSQVKSNPGILTDFRYNQDSIGAVSFYIPEFLIGDDNDTSTLLHINNNKYHIETDNNNTGIMLQRRTVPTLSRYSVVRNYHYIVNAYINAQGGIQIETFVEPWEKDEYSIIFQGDKTIVVPPVIPTDSGVIIIPVLCDGISKIEILGVEEHLPQGLQGGYGDVVNYWDPVIGGPTIIKGQPPYYCEKKYGKGWRFINSCELMSFLAIFDQAYRIWQSNTWQGVNSGLPFYPLPFRQQAQDLLQNLTGVDLSGIVLTDNGKDNLGDAKLGVVDQYFTPGDIMLKESDYPNGWPYTAPPNNSGQKWYPSEVVIQVKSYWYPGYLDLSIPGNKEKVLYEEFQRYDYSSTVSRCVRTVE